VAVGSLRELKIESDTTERLLRDESFEQKPELGEGVIQSRL
jgi:hypothetical protein